MQVWGPYHWHRMKDGREVEAAASLCPGDLATPWMSFWVGLHFPCGCRDERNRAVTNGRKLGDVKQHKHVN